MISFLLQAKNKKVEGKPVSKTNYVIVDLYEQRIKLDQGYAVSIGVLNQGQIRTAVSVQNATYLLQVIPAETERETDILVELKQKKKHKTERCVC